MTEDYDLPALTAGIKNQGLNNYVPRNNETTILKNVISISANGANTGATFYQSNDFTVLQDAYAIKWKYTNYSPTDNQYLFLVGTISKTIFGQYEWTNKANWTRIKNNSIQLPIKNGEIDFDFMDSFIAELEAEQIAELEAEQIAELEAYLLTTGLHDYVLTDEEQQVLENLEKIKYKEFNLEKLFDKSTRGKRLKSADRILGNIPFVTAGETNEGISAYIGNNIEIFPKNTVTIDMFGSAKYRNYPYGADDHIAVVYTQNIAKCAVIFITSAIHKASHSGQFDYSRNFYAKDADQLNIQLPTKENQPDYKTMELIISAVQKLVIKDVVNYADNKIVAIKKVVNRDRKRA